MRASTLYRARAGTFLPMSGGYITLGAYFINLAIGTPPVNFSVLVDTGSSNTAVPSVDCKTTCGNTIKYNPLNSKSSSPVLCNSAECLKCNLDSSNECLFGQPFCSSVRPSDCGFGISYGGGSSALYGSYQTDLLCLGDLCATSTLGMISEGIFFGDLGILGLASDNNACNPSCVPTLMDDLLSSGVMSQNILGMCLTPTQGGVLDMGFIDNTRFQGNLTWIPLSVDDWYNMAILDVQIGPHSINLPSFMYGVTNDVIGSFVDSGTSVILMGPAIFESFTNVFQTYFCHLPGICGSQTFFNGMCFNTSQINPDAYPYVSFLVNDQEGFEIELEVSPHSYLMQTGNVYCLGIAPAVSLGIILGDVFLSGFYTAYDRANSRLGFANQELNCSTK